ncbi:MAG: hypothetical protein K2X66_11355 [Cyanobacteria bacterium]|nr:hypothetical protein [Cyanobacteriota bacterium]
MMRLFSRHFLSRFQLNRIVSPVMAGLSLGALGLVVMAQIFPALENAAYADSKVSATSEQLDKLSALRSFEVEVFTQTFPGYRQPMDADNIQYLRNALNRNNLLPKGSPAQGFLHLECAHQPECNLMRLYVTEGRHGQEVWSKTYPKYKLFVTWWLHNIEDPMEKLSQKMVQELAADYQANHKNPSTSQVSVERIQINDPKP